MAAPPEGVLDTTVQAVALQTSWDRRGKRGCQLLVTLSSGRELWVVEQEDEPPEDTVARYEERIGQPVEHAVVDLEIPFENGGRQWTLDLHLGDGFRFEGNLMEVAARTDEEPETAWTFEGTPQRPE